MDINRYFCQTIILAYNTVTLDYKINNFKFENNTKGPEDKNQMKHKPNVYIRYI